MDSLTHMSSPIGGRLLAALPALGLLGLLVSWGADRTRTTPPGQCPSPQDPRTERQAAAMTWEIGAAEHLQPMGAPPTAVGPADWAGDGSGRLHGAPKDPGHRERIVGIAAAGDRVWTADRSGRVAEHGPAGVRTVELGVEVTALAADLDGAWIGDANGALHRWAHGPPSSTADPHRGAIVSIAAAPEGPVSLGRDGTVLRRSAVGRVVDATGGPAARVAACADGRVVTARTDGTIWLGATRIGALDTPASALACATRVAAGSPTGTLRVWETDGTEVARRGCLGPVRDLTWDGERLRIAAEPRRPVTVAERWYRRAAGVLRGDLGRSLLDGRPVTAHLREALPVTAAVQTGGMGIAISAGIALGAVAARRPGGPFDRAAMAMSLVFHAVPGFWLATLLIAVFASPAGLGWLPLGGLRDPDGAAGVAGLPDLGRHLVLPVLVAAHVPLVRVAATVRAHLVVALHATWAERMRSAGLPESAVARAALRHAGVQLLPLFGGMLPALVAGGIVVEAVFGLPGMGRLARDAARAGDTDVLLVLSGLAALLALVGTIVADALTTRVVDEDPP